MHAPAVQHNDQRSSQLPMQHAQEAPHIFRRNIVIMEAKIAAQSQCPRSQAQSPQHAPAVVSIPSTKHGRTSLWRPSPPSEWLQHQASFIEKYQASFSFKPLFLVGAKLHIATEQSPSGLARALVGWAFARSNPACAVVCPHSRRDTRHRKVVESHFRFVHTSTNRWRNRSGANHGQVPSIDAAFAPRTIVADVLAPVWTSTPARLAAPLRHASDLPMKRWLQSGGRHRSTSCPAEATRPPAVSELPTVGLFHEVSCPQFNTLR